MVKVKFVARGLTRGSDPAQYRRMLPDAAPKWGDSEFIFDVDAKEYDWLVIYHDIPDREGLLNELAIHCPQERTILITLEPSSITMYGRDYVKQFGMVITFQEPWALKHNNVKRRAPGLMWYYGYSFDDDTASSYDTLASEIPQKSKNISTMCSSRTGRVTLHSKRLGFSQQLERDLPSMEVFGHGIRRIDDKAEALRPYRYHVVVENHIAPHHLTEKLPDAFLGHTLPFYHGAPNAHEYFPRESFIPIDINDYERSLEIIKSHIANNEYQDRLPYIQKARRIALEQLNMFAIVDEEIANHRSSLSRPPERGVVYNRRTLRIKKPLAGVRSLTEKLYGKGRHALQAYLR